MIVLGFMPVKAISAEDKATFDQILQPVLRIYDFVKYAATIIAALFLVFTAISYMTAGTDAKKRDNSKFMAGSVIFGLVIIWATPFLINFILGQ
ncbi:hypothetical protein HY498_01795 [Candidatus Woesearchaeota archaeon]|nr:hypothetical protein [Candidatus Woesearchaeota archaeon]